METPAMALAIKRHLQEMCAHFASDFIVIGGWAAHAYGLKAYSLDGDAMVSAVAMGEIRDQEVVTPNPRMHKSQYVKDGWDVDLYVEYQHHLRVPFEEVQSAHRQIEGLNVPCPEHLLILKIEAAKARRGTEKGFKDFADLVGLVGVIAAEPRCDILQRYLRPEDMGVVREAIESPRTWDALGINNSHEASRKRQACAQEWSRLVGLCGLSESRPNLDLG